METKGGSTGDAGKAEPAKDQLDLEAEKWFDKDRLEQFADCFERTPFLWKANHRACKTRSILGLAYTKLLRSLRERVRRDSVRRSMALCRVFVSLLREQLLLAANTSWCNGEGPETALQRCPPWVRRSNGYLQLMPDVFESQRPSDPLGMDQLAPIVQSNTNDSTTTTPNPDFGDLEAEIDAHVIRKCTSTATAPTQEHANSISHQESNRHHQNREKANKQKLLKPRQNDIKQPCSGRLELGITTNINKLDQPSATKLSTKSQVANTGSDQEGDIDVDLRNFAIDVMDSLTVSNDNDFDSDGEQEQSSEHEQPTVDVADTIPKTPCVTSNDVSVENTYEDVIANVSTIITSGSSNDNEFEVDVESLARTLPQDNSGCDKGPENDFSAASADDNDSQDEAEVDVESVASVLPKANNDKESEVNSTNVPKELHSADDNCENESEINTSDIPRERNANDNRDNTLETNTSNVSEEPYLSDSNLDNENEKKVDNASKESISNDGDLNKNERSPSSEILLSDLEDEHQDPIILDHRTSVNELCNSLFRRWPRLTGDMRHWLRSHMRERHASGTDSVDLSEEAEHNPKDTGDEKPKTADIDGEESIDCDNYEGNGDNNEVKSDGLVIEEEGDVTAGVSDNIDIAVDQSERHANDTIENPNNEGENFDSKTKENAIENLQRDNSDVDLSRAQTQSVRSVETAVVDIPDNVALQDGKCEGADELIRNENIKITSTLEAQIESVQNEMVERRPSKNVMVRDNVSEASSVKEEVINVNVVVPNPELVTHPLDKSVPKSEPSNVGHQEEVAQRSELNKLQELQELNVGNIEMSKQFPSDEKDATGKLDDTRNTVKNTEDNTNVNKNNEISSACQNTDNLYLSDNKIKNKCFKSNLRNAIQFESEEEDINSDIYNVQSIKNRRKTYKGKYKNASLKHVHKGKKNTDLTTQSPVRLGKSSNNDKNDGSQTCDNRIRKRVRPASDLEDEGATESKNTDAHKISGKSIKIHNIRTKIRKKLRREPRKSNEEHLDSEGVEEQGDGNAMSRSISDVIDERVEGSRVDEDTTEVSKSLNTESEEMNRSPVSPHPALSDSPSPRLSRSPSDASSSSVASSYKRPGPKSVKRRRASRKRVELPDIEEVRQNNQSMLTAQVAPISLRQDDPEIKMGCGHDESLIVTSPGTPETGCSRCAAERLAALSAENNGQQKHLRNAAAKARSVIMTIIKKRTYVRTKYGIKAHRKEYRRKGKRGRRRAQTETIKKSVLNVFVPVPNARENDQNSIPSTSHDTHISDNLTNEQNTMPSTSSYTQVSSDNVTNERKSDQNSVPSTSDADVVSNNVNLESEATNKVTDFEQTTEDLEKQTARNNFVSSRPGPLSKKILATQNTRKQVKQSATVNDFAQHQEIEPKNSLVTPNSKIEGEGKKSTTANDITQNQELSTLEITEPRKNVVTTNSKIEDMTHSMASTSYDTQVISDEVNLVSKATIKAINIERALDDLEKYMSLSQNQQQTTSVHSASSRPGPLSKKILLTQNTPNTKRVKKSATANDITQNPELSTLEIIEPQKNEVTTNTNSKIEDIANSIPSTSYDTQVSSDEENLALEVTNENSNFDRAADDLAKKISSSQNQQEMTSIHSRRRPGPLSKKILLTHKTYNNKRVEKSATANNITQNQELSTLEIVEPHKNVVTANSKIEDITNSIASTSCDTQVSSDEEDLASEVTNENSNFDGAADVLEKQLSSSQNQQQTTSIHSVRCRPGPLSKKILLTQKTYNNKRVEKSATVNDITQNRELSTLEIIEPQKNEVTTNTNSKIEDITNSIASTSYDTQVISDEENLASEVTNENSNFDRATDDLAKQISTIYSFVSSRPSVDSKKILVTQKTSSTKRATQSATAQNQELKSLEIIEPIKIDTNASTATNNSLAVYEDWHSENLTSNEKERKTTRISEHIQFEDDSDWDDFAPDETPQNQSDSDNAPDDENPSDLSNQKVLSIRDSLVKVLDELRMTGTDQWLVDPITTVLQTKDLELPEKTVSKRAKRTRRSPHTQYASSSPVNEVVDLVDDSDSITKNHEKNTSVASKTRTDRFSRSSRRNQKHRSGSVLNKDVTPIIIGDNEPLRKTRERRAKATSKNSEKGFFESLLYGNEDLCGSDEDVEITAVGYQESSSRTCDKSARAKKSGSSLLRNPKKISASVLDENITSITIEDKDNEHTRETCGKRPKIASKMRGKKFSGSPLLTQEDHSDYVLDTDVTPIIIEDQEASRKTREKRPKAASKIRVKEFGRFSFLTLDDPSGSVSTDEITSRIIEINEGRLNSVLDEDVSPMIIEDNETSRKTRQRPSVTSNIRAKDLSRSSLLNQDDIADSLSEEESTPMIIENHENSSKTRERSSAASNIKVNEFGRSSLLTLDDSDSISNEDLHLMSISPDNSVYLPEETEHNTNPARKPKAKIIIKKSSLFSREPLLPNKNRMLCLDGREPLTEGHSQRNKFAIKIDFKRKLKQIPVKKGMYAPLRSPDLDDSDPEDFSSTFTNDDDDVNPIPDVNEDAPAAQDADVNTINARLPADCTIVKLKSDTITQLQARPAITATSSEKTILKRKRKKPQRHPLTPEDLSCYIITADAPTQKYPPNTPSIFESPDLSDSDVEPKRVKLAKTASSSLINSAAKNQTDSQPTEELSQTSMSELTDIDTDSTHYNPSSNIGASDVIQSSEDRLDEEPSNDLCSPVIVNVMSLASNESTNKSVQTKAPKTTVKTSAPIITLKRAEPVYASSNPRVFSSQPATDGKEECNLPKVIHVTGGVPLSLRPSIKTSKVIRLTKLSGKPVRVISVKKMTHVTQNTSIKTPDLPYTMDSKLVPIPKIIKVKHGMKNIKIHSDCKVDFENTTDIQKYPVESSGVINMDSPLDNPEDQNSISDNSTKTQEPPKECPVDSEVTDSPPVRVTSGSSDQVDQGVIEVTSRRREPLKFRPILPKITLKRAEPVHILPMCEIEDTLTTDEATCLPQVSVVAGNVDITSMETDNETGRHLIVSQEELSTPTQDNINIATIFPQLSDVSCGEDVPSTDTNQEGLHLVVFGEPPNDNIPDSPTQPLQDDDEAESSPAKRISTNRRSSINMPLRSVSAGPSSVKDSLYSVSLVDQSLDQSQDNETEPQVEEPGDVAILVPADEDANANGTEPLFPWHKPGVPAKTWALDKKASDLAVLCVGRAIWQVRDCLVLSARAPLPPLFTLWTLMPRVLLILPTEPDETDEVSPPRVQVDGRWFLKVCNRPLKYALLLGVLKNAAACWELMLQDAPVELYCRNTGVLYTVKYKKLDRYPWVSLRAAIEVRDSVLALQRALCAVAAISSTASTSTPDQRLLSSSEPLVLMIPLAPVKESRSWSTPEQDLYFPVSEPGLVATPMLVRARSSSPPSEHDRTLLLPSTSESDLVTPMFVRARSCSPVRGSPSPSILAQTSLLPSTSEPDNLVTPMLVRARSCSPVRGSPSPSILDQTSLLPSTSEPDNLVTPMFVRASPVRASAPPSILDQTSLLPSTSEPDLVTPMFVRARSCSPVGASLSPSILDQTSLLPSTSEPDNLVTPMFVRARSCSPVGAALSPSILDQTSILPSTSEPDNLATPTLVRAGSPHPTLASLLLFTPDQASLLPSTSEPDNPPLVAMPPDRARSCPPGPTSLSPPTHDQTSWLPSTSESDNLPFVATPPVRAQSCPPVPTSTPPTVDQTSLFPLSELDNPPFVVMPPVRAQSCPPVPTSTPPTVDQTSLLPLSELDNPPSVAMPPVRPQSCPPVPTSTPPTVDQASLFPLSELDNYPPVAMPSDRGQSCPPVPKFPSSSTSDQTSLLPLLELDNPPSVAMPPVRAQSCPPAPTSTPPTVDQASLFPSSAVDNPPLVGMTPVRAWSCPSIIPEPPSRPLSRSSSASTISAPFSTYIPSPVRSLPSHSCSPIPPTSPPSPSPSISSSTMSAPSRSCLPSPVPSPIDHVTIGFSPTVSCPTPVPINVRSTPSPIPAPIFFAPPTFPIASPLRSTSPVPATPPPVSSPVPGSPLRSPSPLPAASSPRYSPASSSAPAASPERFESSPAASPRPMSPDFAYTDYTQEASPEPDQLDEDSETISRPIRTLEELEDVCQMSDWHFLDTYRLPKDRVLALIQELRPYVPPLEEDDISPGKKILVCLNFLATGADPDAVAEATAQQVSRATVCGAITQVLEALGRRSVYRRHVRFPESPRERAEVKHGFYSKFGLTGVLGAMCGVHVPVMAPEPPERFYNGVSHSLNVQLVCDADMRIISVDTTPGGASPNCEAWASHPLNSLTESLVERGESVYFVTDATYLPQQTILTPVTAALTPNQKLYAAMHRRAHQTILRCISTLKARWRCLSHGSETTAAAPELCASVVEACAVLHNIAIGAELPWDEDFEEKERELTAQLNASQRDSIERYLRSVTSAERARLMRDMSRGRSARRHVVRQLQDPTRRESSDVMTPEFESVMEPRSDPRRPRSRPRHLVSAARRHTITIDEESVPVATITIDEEDTVTLGESSAANNQNDLEMVIDDQSESEIPIVDHSIHSMLETGIGDQNVSGTATRDLSKSEAATRDLSKSESATRDQSKSGSATRDQSVSGTVTRELAVPGTSAATSSAPASSMGRFIEKLQQRRFERTKILQAMAEYGSDYDDD